MDRLDYDTVQDFLAKSGKNGAKLLSVLGKQLKLVQAFESEIGREILRDASARSEYLLDRIIAEEATESERAEFRVLKRLLAAWGERVKAYYINLEKIKVER